MDVEKAEHKDTLAENLYVEDPSPNTYKTWQDEMRHYRTCKGNLTSDQQMYCILIHKYMHEYSCWDFFFNKNNLFK